MGQTSFDFSFSGLKSAVARHVQKNNVTTDEDKAQVAASFQAAVIDVLCKKLIRAAEHKQCRCIGIAGGVSANQTFVARLSASAREKKISVFAPPPELCGDNAAMIAARGYTMIQQGQLCRLDHDVFSRTRID